MVAKDKFPRHKVLVVKSNLLPLSETFIKNQVLSYQSWQPVLLGMFPENPGLGLERIETILLHHQRDVFAWRDMSLLTRFRLARSRHLKLLRSQNASLLHVHFATEAVIWWPLLRKLNLPVAITLHGQDINVNHEVWKQHRLWSPWHFYPERLISLATDPRTRFVAVSHAIRNRAIEFGLPADRICVCYIGINRQEFSPSEVPIGRRRRRILFVGRLVEKKGAQYLIQAYAAVRKTFPDAELVIIGSGPLLGELRSLAAELQQPVEFAGSLPHHEVKQHLVTARVLCSPSVTAADGDAEGLPTVIPEAQACGLPVVTSARGGATEGILDTKSGFAFKERDVQSLTKHLIQLLSDNDLAQSMSLTAVDYAAQAFDIRKCTQKLESKYDEWLAEARAHTSVRAVSA